MNITEAIKFYGNQSIHDVSANFEFSVMDMVKHYCIQIDQKLMWLALLILTMYIFRMVMLPRAIETYRELLPQKWKTNAIRFLDQVGDYADTFGYLAANVLVYWVWVQVGASLVSKIWYGIVMGILLLSGIANFIQWIRNKGWEKWKNQRI